MKGTFAPKATDTNANRNEPTRTDSIEVATAMKSIKGIACGKKLQKQRDERSGGRLLHFFFGGARADEWRVKTSSGLLQN
jgi:hypothetical protein